MWSQIERQARTRPEQTAIVDGNAEIDYRRLAGRAEAIAGELLARGVEPGALVGVCMRRSWELAATLVGILRAGCAYVPLDPAYPRERVRYMLEHSRAVAAIVDHDRNAELCAGVPRLVRLHEVAARGAEGARAPSPRDLAYVIYTSGSTGRPKGVAVEHRSVVAMTRAMRELLDDGELAGVLAAASVCFDPSVMEILGTLSLGGTVVLASNVLAFPELPHAERVRTAIMVPSSMQALLSAAPLPAGVRSLVFGGEVLKRSLVDRLHAREPRPRIVNVYGPTEATVFATVKEVPAGGEAITIGRPVTGTRAYVLDGALRPVPAGAPGELYLAGDQLARGYLHDAGLTRERFVAPDPDGPVAEERLYRTGDLCRRREDGELDFLGRADHQVKIRGFRIELEEIESALESREGVDRATATVFEGEAGEKLLVGYVVTRDPELTGEAARAYLAERLPAYMVPQVVVQVDALPVSPGGKVDRARLPRPGERRGTDRREHPGRRAGDPLVPEGASAEERRAALLAVVRREIAALLPFGGAEEVAPDRTLDALGVDSLNAVELGVRLSRIAGVRLPLAALLDHHTPATVADRLLALAERGAADEPAATRRRDGAADTLGGFQAKLRTSHPPFLAARASSWSATDRGTLVRELRTLASRRSGDPYGKLVRTGSAHRGTVADAQSGVERDAIIWTTNLYLGLNRDPEVMAAARSAVEQLGTGMGTSAAASGVTDLHVEFERAFAEHVGKPAACLFPTGFTANLGVIAGLLGENDVVVMDQLSHASIVDGARLSGAAVRTFRHNDAADLDAVLRSEASPYRTVLVAIESVYSMGEGAAPVEELARTAKRHGALVLVDEAHSLGFYGPRGAGLCAERGATADVDFILTTLSKALGSLGGVVAAREEHVALLKATAAAYIFQASASPADIAAALASLRRLRADDALRERLWSTTAYMRKRFAEAGFDLGTGDGPIVTPHFGDRDTLYAIAAALYRRGVHTAAVTYPIVEAGRGRLRFICSAAHTREEVDRTLEALIEAEREVREEREARKGHPTPEAPISAPPARSGVESWIHDFRAHLRETRATSGAPLPELALSIALPDGGPPLALTIGHDAVIPEAGTPPHLPTCTLRFTDERTASALCANDVQALLDSVVEGSCVTSGQVEPFVWLIGRMVEMRSATE